MTIVIAQHIDVSVFLEADILVRFHTGSAIANAGSSFVIGAMADGYTFDDPAPLTSAGGYADFLSAVATKTQPGAVQATSTSSYPLFELASLNVGIGATSAPFGRFLAVTLYAKQGLAGSQLVAVLSVDLVLKSGDPNDLPATANAYHGYRVA